MPSLRDSNPKSLHLCYKHAAPPELIKNKRPPIGSLVLKVIGNCLKLFLNKLQCALAFAVAHFYKVNAFCKRAYIKVLACGIIFI
jgi:hypothetical protein